MTFRHHRHRAGAACCSKSVRRSPASLRINIGRTRSRTERRWASIADAAWSYETPLKGVEAIGGYLAFYSNKVTVEQL